MNLYLVTLPVYATKVSVYAIANGLDEAERLALRWINDHVTDSTERANSIELLASDDYTKASEIVSGILVLPQ